MAGSLTDFFKSVMGQPQAGQAQSSPFSQLVSSDGKYQQNLASQDNLSPEDQRLALQRMLQMRNQTSIPTINPGTTWGGYDKNAIMPDDVMSGNSVRQYRQDRI